MIETYVKEFTAVAKYLSTKGKGIKKGSFLIAPKNTVVDLLNKNMYETSDAKLRIWRSLMWTDADRDRLTCRIYKEGKTILGIKINLKIYEVLAKILEEGEQNVFEKPDESM